MRTIAAVTRRCCLGLVLIIGGAYSATAATQEANVPIAWYRSMYVEPYAKANNQAHPWDRDALKVLDMAARRFAGTADAPSQDEVGSLEKSIIDAGCADPLIFYVYYIHLRATGPTASDGELDGPDEIWLRKALDGFRRSDYPKYLTMKAALSVALMEERPGNSPTSQSRRLAWEAVDAAIQSTLTNEYLYAEHMPERAAFVSAMEYLRAMCGKAGLDTAEVFQRIVDRVGNNVDFFFIDELDRIASHERVADHREWDTLERTARKLLRTEKFDDLDALAFTLHTKKSRFRDGEWQSVRLYDALALPYKSSREDWTKRFQLVESWTNAKPDSAAARLVLARTYYEYAWNARGGGYAKDVNPEGWRLFLERLQTAHLVLKDMRPDMRADPEWYRLMLMVLAPGSWHTSAYHKYLRQGLALEPSYDWFDKLIAWYSLPRWYGNPGDWQQVAEAAAARTTAEDGDSFYTRVVWHIWDSVDGSGSPISGRFFAENQISWPRLKQGFRDMEKRYPDSLWNLNAFCRFACMAQDKETARELFDRIGARWDKAMWSNRMMYREWQRWAHSK